MKYTWIIILLLFASASSAEIFMQQDEKGNITYSDQPLDDDAKAIELPQVNQTPTLSDDAKANKNVKTDVASDSPQTSDAETVAPSPYTTFDFTTPVDQQTFQNQPVIPVMISMKPELQEGDTIQLLYDGQPTGPAIPNTSFNLTQLERGTHVLEAVLFNKDNKVIKKTSAITIFVHQGSIKQ